MIQFDDELDDCTFGINNKPRPAPDPAKQVPVFDDGTTSAEEDSRLDRYLRREDRCPPF